MSASSSSLLRVLLFVLGFLEFLLAVAQSLFDHGAFHDALAEFHFHDHAALEDLSQPDKFPLNRGHGVVHATSALKNPRMDWKRALADSIWNASWQARRRQGFCLQSQDRPAS